MFKTLFYQPILWVLVFIYQNIAFHDLGVAIILLTVLVRLVLLPFFYRGAKDQTLIQKIQPLVKKIQEDHKGNKEKQTQALLELYRQHRINPFSSFLLLIIQLPILIALYRVFLTGLSNNVVFDNYQFLGLINLNERSFVLVILATLAQYFQGRLMMPKAQPGRGAAANRFGQTMLFLGPALTLVILINFPAALGLYWLTSSLFSLGQQIFINKALKKHGENIRENKKTA
jgi:YidC/Oxa1 family membrane protein insertase